MTSAASLRIGMEPYPGYRLRQLLGRGGFAEVWETEAEDGKTLALKFLPCKDETATSREIRSIQSVRQLHHPNLIEIYQVWCQPGYIVVAMELAEGSLTDLFDAYRELYGTPIVPEQVCLYLSQAACAIDFLNGRTQAANGQVVPIQHCDIKPSNMLLFGDHVKLADFGLSSQITSNLQSHRRGGTLQYTAPEVFQGRLSNQTDQYSLAVTYCLLRGGRWPFPNDVQTFDHSYVRPEPDLTMLSEPERPIVARALSPVPQNRWPSCEEFMAHLSQVVC